jgi:hypothetical protein
MTSAVARPGVRWRLGATSRKSVLVVHIASAGTWLGIDVVMAVPVFTALGSDDDRTKALYVSGAGAGGRRAAARHRPGLPAHGIVLGLSSKYG